MGGETELFLYLLLERTHGRILQENDGPDRVHVSSGRDVRQRVRGVYTHNLLVPNITPGAEQEARKLAQEIAQGIKDFNRRAICLGSRGRPRKYSFINLTVSFPPKDREKLARIPGGALRVSREIIFQVAGKGRALAIIEHGDTDHPHTQGALSIYDKSGHYMNLSHDRARFYNAVREIEQQHGLTLRVCRYDPERHSLSVGEHRALASYGVPDLPQQLRNTVTAGLAARPSRQLLVNCLRDVGVEFRQGRKEGHVFECRELPTVKASSVNRMFSAKYLPTFLDERQTYLGPEAKDRVRLVMQMCLQPDSYRLHSTQHLMSEIRYAAWAAEAVSTMPIGSTWHDIDSSIRGMNLRDEAELLIASGSPAWYLQPQKSQESHADVFKVVELPAAAFNRGPVKAPTIAPFEFQYEPDSRDEPSGRGSSAMSR
jgi:hypothetical protein